VSTIILPQIPLTNAPRAINGPKANGLPNFILPSPIAANGLLKIGSLAIYYTLPHMVQVSPGSIMGSAGRIAPFIEWSLIYGVLYSGIWLFGGVVLFRKRAV